MTKSAALNTRAPASRARRARQVLVTLLPGLGLSGALALAATVLGRTNWLQQHGLSPLPLAIALGILVGNTVYPRLGAVAGAGVTFSKQRLLRLGVVLYGLRLTVQDIAHVGVAGVTVDALMVASTFALACFVGQRGLGLDRKMAMLIGVGSSICGAAAVIAAEPVVRGRAEQVTVAVATVVLFGTVGIFLYPYLYSVNQHWLLIPGGVAGFGIYAGSTIHEVAQVVAAARSVGEGAADTAVIAKMVRVMMLAPFLIGLSAWLARSDAHRHAAGGAASHGGAATAKLPVPWFAFGFTGVVLFNSLHWLPMSIIVEATEFDTILLAMAMAALGLTTHLGALLKVGIKPLLLALILFGWLVAGGALINRWIALLFA